MKIGSHEVDADKFRRYVAAVVASQCGAKVDASKTRGPAADSFTGRAPGAWERFDVLASTRASGIVWWMTPEQKLSCRTNPSFANVSKLAKSAVARAREAKTTYSRGVVF